MKKFLSVLFSFLLVFLVHTINVRAATENLDLTKKVYTYSDSNGGFNPSKFNTVLNGGYINETISLNPATSTYSFVKKMKCTSILVDSYNNTIKFIMNFQKDGVNVHSKMYYSTGSNVKNYSPGTVNFEFDTIKISTAESTICMQNLRIIVEKEIEPLGILSVLPANLRNDVALNEQLNIIFNKNIQSADISVNGINGTKTIVNNTLNFVPSNSFQFDTQYTVNVSNVVAVDGMTLSSYSYSFRTVKDTIPVSVVYIKPPPDSENIPIDQNVEIKFNKVIDTNSIGNVTVINNTTGNSVGLSKQLSLDILRLNFTELLLNETSYTIKISNVKDLLGNTMLSDVNVNFKTVRDTTDLILLEYRPPSGIVPLYQDFEFKFNKNVDPTSLKFTFKDIDGNNASITYNVVGNIVRFLPSLQTGKKYVFEFLEGSTLSGIVTPINLKLNIEVMTSSGEPVFDDITSNNLNLFNEMNKNGLIIFLSFISLAVIFTASLWLYRKLKIWLKKQ